MSLRRFFYTFVFLSIFFILGSLSFSSVAFAANPECSNGREFLGNNADGDPICYGGCPVAQADNPPDCSVGEFDHFVPNYYLNNSGWHGYITWTCSTDTRVVCAAVIYGDSRRGDEAPNPVDGVCATAHPYCLAGSVGAISESTDSWQWYCNGANGGSNALCSEPKLIVSLQANPNQVQSGASSLLSWNTQNAGTCYASGSSDWSGPKTVNNGVEQKQLVKNITTNTIYTLTCSNLTATNYANTLVLIKACVPDCTTSAGQYCSSQTYDDGCGGSCLGKGTRYCDTSWKEVSP